jgi:DNA repair protein SbcD/Mre11
VLKILTVNDIHLSDRPPSSCTEAYTEDLLDLLGQTVAEAVSRDVDAVVWTGDVFHSKAPSRNSHRLVQKAIGIGHAYGRPWYIVPGNHDLQHDRLASIHETQPLGVLYRAGAKMLRGWELNGLPLYGVPWQQEWSDEAVGEALREWREAGRYGAALVCAHAPLYPPGHELPYEYYDTVMWSQAMGNRGSCVYGHVHERHGVYQVNDVTFCNPGALSRGSLHEYNMTRPVQVAVWDSSDGSFSEVQLTAKPAEEVFRLREKQRITDASGKLDEFLAQVGSTRLAVLSSESVLEHVRQLGLDPAVAEEVRELLDWAGHQQ